MSRGKKRFWSDDEKREICRQAATEGFSVAQVARRYAVNANLIHNWMKDPRFATPTEDITSPPEDAFLPVEVELSAQPIDRMVTTPSASALCATRVDLTLSDGRRVLIEGPTALSAVVGLVEGLAV
ncbi:transposase [Amylibacter sp. IMCC11727]|uniref:IS66-like element accessory protein TnpA n=1 Tax=Amylibacter sp. IMCC11727 TaxID=3039851 RepID=UPI00244DED86|nr:transposase [Amylibacter sp. IMCC11727]WGI21222.1 transposase [Amylibacter sp. IMCC11727]WGI21230.1 transposase [Amylibacter sp. IMCC11727]WGI21917.1 transposase [Amylibacter sp. IMCC11727]WGI22400.1 transposase [Amylibacter sp. IMCC11727]WGI22934.1 transposase [Amylibacter sp. IMCC11727]